MGRDGDNFEPTTFGQLQYITREALRQHVTDQTGLTHGKEFEQALDDIARNPMQVNEIEEHYLANNKPGKIDPEAYKQGGPDYQGIKAVLDGLPKKGPGPTR